MSVNTIIGITVDTVASRQEAVEHARRLNDDLERRVRVRTAELLAAHDDLRTSEARLKEAQEAAHIGSWEWQLSDGRVWWSKELYKICGVDPEAFVPSQTAFFELVHPDDRAPLNRALEQSLLLEQPFEVEHRITRPSGDVHTCTRRVRSSPANLLNPAACSAWRRTSPTRSGSKRSCSGTEARSAWPADRRSRARLQQPAHGDYRLYGSVAGRRRADGSTPGGTARGQKGGRARGGADAAAPRLQPTASARSADHQRERCHREYDEAAAAVDRGRHRRDDGARQRPPQRHHRSRSFRAGPHESRGQCSRRDA